YSRVLNFSGQRTPGGADMGRRGPPPTPTKILELRGSWRAKERPGEPQPPPGAPPMPEWLSEEARAEWQRMAPELEALGLLSVLDRAALAAYCQAYAELVEATALLNREGRVLEAPVFSKAGELTGHVRKPHPAVRLQRDAFGRVKQFLAE